MELISETDRSIFDEFDSRQKEQEIARTEDSVAVRLAKLTAKNVDDESLQRIFNISLAQLREVRKSADYLSAFSDAVGNEVERPLTIDDAWDEIEDKALRAAKSQIDFVDADTALTMALRANKAKRRTRENEIDDKSRSINIKTVNIAVPHALMESLANVNLSTEMQKLVDANAQNKIVDMARPKRIDDMMREKVREEETDADIMKTFDL